MRSPEQDLHDGRERASAEALFALGSSGHAADVAQNKDAYVGEAVDSAARAPERR